MKTVYLTDEQMAELSWNAKQKCPWTARKNNIYQAEAVVTWKVKIDEKHLDLLPPETPCEINGFEF